MSNIKKILLVVIAIIVCGVLLKLIFNLSNKYSIDKLATNIVPSGEQTANSLPKGGTVATNSQDNTNIEAKLIESKGLAEFYPSNDIKSPVDDNSKEISNEINQVIRIGGDNTDKNKVQESLTGLNTLINKYPDDTFLYIQRIEYYFILGNTNYAEINNDLDNAIKYSHSKKYGMSSLYDKYIYLLKAKIDKLNGDKKSEIDHLTTSVEANLESYMIYFDFSDYFSLKETDLNYHPASFSLSDFNSLVQSYPDDFRVYTLRGFYYSVLSFSNKQYFSLALADLNKAIKLNPKSTEAYYLIGKLYLDSDTDNKKLSEAINYFNKAIAVDPTSKYVYIALAETYNDSKNYSEAIKNYGKIIELDSNNSDVYEKKALAEGNLRQDSQMIIDISKAIQIRENSPSKLDSVYLESSLSPLYGVRAEHYSNNKEYKNAIADYNKIISATFARQLRSMKLETVRYIYPEFSDISDKDLIEGLRQKYYSDSNPIEFYNSMINNKEDTRRIYSENGIDYTTQNTLSYLYLLRGDAYYKNNDSRTASIEYARVLHNFPKYKMDKIRLSVMNGTR